MDECLSVPRFLNRKMVKRANQFWLGFEKNYLAACEAVKTLLKYTFPIFFKDCLFALVKIVAFTHVRRFFKIRLSISLNSKAHFNSSTSNDKHTAHLFFDKVGFFF